jgi:hypothetical protein
MIHKLRNVEICLGDMSGDCSDKVWYAGLLLGGSRNSACSLFDETFLHVGTWLCLEDVGLLMAQFWAISENTLT